MSHGQPKRGCGQPTIGQPNTKESKMRMISEVLRAKQRGEALL